MHKNAIFTNKKGFTLIEISIVVVILSLIVAGVVAGRSIVNQAQVRNIAIDMQKYISATNTFRSVYNAYPGDITNATSYWTGGVTNNGNGNGIINHDLVPDISTSEAIRAWEHMSLARIIQGSYSGNGTLIRNRNIPAAPRDRGIYTFLYYSNYGRLGTMLSVATLHKTIANYPWNSILTSAEAKSIDDKFDDGIAGKGWIVGGRGNDFGDGYCIDNDYTASTATYLLNDTGVHCRLFFYLNFK